MSKKRRFFITVCTLFSMSCSVYLCIGLAKDGIEQPDFADTVAVSFITEESGRPSLPELEVGQPAEGGKGFVAVTRVKPHRGTFRVPKHYSVFRATTPSSNFIGTIPEHASAIVYKID